jgi:dihydroorotase
VKILIRGGRVIDPGRSDGLKDIYIEDANIAAIKKSDTASAQDTADQPDPQPFAADRIIEAAGKIVAPGLIDLHVHIPEPGFEYKETIASGCKAAAKGGFTAVCTMPDTHPVNDNYQVTEFILNKASAVGKTKVLPIAAVTQGLKGEQLCEYGDLKAAGAVALSEGGRCIMNSMLMRKAMEYAKGFGLSIISHCEDHFLSAGVAMNEGPVATRLGLSGAPNAAESVMVMRDLALCEFLQVPLHLAHITTKESVRAIREAKERGVPVTAATAPHYFTLTDEALQGYNTYYKTNPPLRSREDRNAICEALADGTIDVIASGHLPQSSIEKDVEFDFATAGMIGLETSLGLSLKLVDEGHLTLVQLIEKMATHPAHFLGLNPHLEVGAAANMTLIDPDRAYTVNDQALSSLSRNTPFMGWELTGKAVLTVVDGRIVHDDL